MLLVNDRESPSAGRPSSDQLVLPVTLADHEELKSPTQVKLAGSTRSSSVSCHAGMECATDGQREIERCEDFRRDLRRRGDCRSCEQFFSQFWRDMAGDFQEEQRYSADDLVTLGAEWERGPAACPQACFAGDWWQWRGRVVGKRQEPHAGFRRPSEVGQGIRIRLVECGQGVSGLPFGAKTG